ncbi:MAG TPA: hypothetical protein VF676_07030 [Flavobacterium sp.]|jgi:hypothetical protein
MNRPEKVRLEVFKLHLSPRREQRSGIVTFRDLFLKKLGASENILDADLFQQYVQLFIRTIDTDYQRVRNKAFTLINTPGQTGYSAANNTVHGVLEGGLMGEGKTRRNFSNKTDGNPLDGSVINDKYFFYIHTPLDDNTGYLMFQIYQQDSIRAEFVRYIAEHIFKYNPDYNMANYDPYLPQSIKDEFRHSAKVKEVKFSERVLSSELDSSASFTTINESYKVEVKIIPLNSTFGMPMLDAFLGPLLGKTFNNVRLSNFDNKKVTLQNRQTGKNATFELDGMGDIMPRIYLHNKISIDQNGVPDFVELKSFCDTLLNRMVDDEPGVREV